MASFDFPSTPSNGQSYSANGITFTFDGTAWKRETGAVKGQKGEVGAGDKGQKGESVKGEKGQKGQDGNDGTSVKGNKGEVGQKGEKGQKGESGTDGTDGTKGQKGQDGNDGTGIKGNKGEVGDKGQKGEDNSTKGQKGEVGADNSTKGQKGQKGDDGTDGTSVKGQKGEAGADNSTKGQKGEAGADNSTKGQKGEAGSSVKGQKGEAGAGTKGQKGEAGPVAGSANQVVYKNSSNVATGSNNLTFDGNILKLPSTTLSDDGDGTYTVNGPHLQIGSNAANSLQLWHDSVSGLSGISEVGSGDFSIITNGTNLYIQKDATAGYAEDMIHCIANGAVKLFYNGGTTPKVETTNTGAKVNGNLEVTGTISPSGMVVNARTSGYSLVASDAGKLVTMTTGDCSVLQNVFSAGNAVTVYNNSSSSFSILQGSGVTMYLSGTTSTGNRTLHQRGMATIVCVASNTFSIAGSGLS